MPKLEPTFAFIVSLLTAVAVLGTLFFWTVGAALLVTENGGTINDMAWLPVSRTLFFVYPVVALLALATSSVLFALRRTTEAVGFASLPLAGLVVFYLVSVVTLV